MIYKACEYNNSGCIWPLNRSVETRSLRFSLKQITEILTERLYYKHLDCRTMKPKHAKYTQSMVSTPTLHARGTVVTINLIARQRAIVGYCMS